MVGVAVDGNHRNMDSVGVDHVIGAVPAIRGKLLSRGEVGERDGGPKRRCLVRDAAVRDRQFLSRSL